MPAKSPAPPRPALSLPQASSTPPATPVRPLKASTRGLTHLNSAAVELERRRQKEALPKLGEKLIAEVVQQAFEEVIVDLLKIIKQEAAARTYVKAKARRKEDIERWSGWVFDAVRAGDIESIAREALLSEVARRYLIRRAVWHWRDWAEESRQARETAIKEREETFDRLRFMGLGETIFVDKESASLPSLELEKVHKPLDAFETDVALHQVRILAGFEARRD